MRAMTEEPHEFALTKAKIFLMSRPDSAFFTTLAFRLHHVFDPSIPTAATNGKTIYYNPDFFMSLDLAEQVFLILHEAMHVALEHIIRAENFNPTKYNIAADHVINLMLIERGFKMPQCGLADPQYSGLSTEEVYRLLPDDVSDPQGIGQDLKDPAGAIEDLQRDIQDILVQASVQSKLAKDKPGTIPGEIEVYLDKLLNPKLPWHRILQKYLHSFARNDFTFKRPNRRFFPKNYLPSLLSHNLVDLAAFVDISASVSDTEFNVQVSETANIMKMMKPSKITFGQFDTNIKSIDQIRNLRDMMNLKFTGRGGTNITPVLEWANQHKPQLLLIFSDGDFHIPTYLKVKVPTVWLIYNNPNFQAPFGKVIHYEI